MRALALLALVACGRIDFDSTPTGSKLAPLAWWKLDDGSGTTAIDSSGHGNNGTLSAGITWAPGRVGGAIVSDGGLNHQVTAGNPALLQLTSSMTLAAWVNASAFHLGDSVDESIVARDDFHNGQSGWALKGTEDCDAKEHFAIQIATTATIITERCTTLIPSANTWYHVVAVYDANSLALDMYVDAQLDDGVLTAPIPMAQYEPTSAAEVEIGNNDPIMGATLGGGDTWTGLIDDVRIYDRPLDASEVSQLAGM